MPRSAPLLLRVGIDTGGTFTDLVAVGGGRTLALKVPSTPADPEQGVLHALSELARLLPRSFPAARARALARLEIVHGTTVATNAVLEGRGARVLLVTNAGFEDLIEIGRQARPDLYDLSPVRPAPLVAREDRLGLAERTLADGSRPVRTGRRELERLVAAVRRRRVAAVRGGAPASLAIGLLHSYANPAAEKLVESRLRALKLPISRSSAVAPLFREYERFSTTVANAALVPLCGRYLERLRRALPRSRLFVMQSNGGWTSARAAARFPVRFVLSGPAGGVTAAATRLAQARVAGAVSLDIGGTSTDVGLVIGAPRRTDQVDLAGRPLLVDALDVHSIGAGGGSLLWIDDGGSLHVGPRSAGADPGPACYGRGTLACLTDAHVALGRLPLQDKLGGAITLEPERSLAALAPLARRLRVAPLVVAAAALDVVDAAMEQAIKKMSLERGHDPRGLALFPFGGAGGLHACRLARRLEMAEVVVPPLPGATSAWGMATSAARLSFAQGLVRVVDPTTRREIAAAARRLAAEARRALVRELGPGPVAVELTIACRYLGQSFELDVPFDSRFSAGFEAAHERHYGFRIPGARIQCVALKAAALRAAPHARGVASPPATSRRPATSARCGVATVLFGPRLAPARVPLLDRSRLATGMRARGPLIVLESTATTVVEPGFTLAVDATGCLRLRDAQAKG